MSLFNNQPVRYGSAALVAALALVVSWWALPLLGARDSSLLVLMSAVVISTWFLGWGPGLLATAVCSVGHVGMLLAVTEDLLGETARLSVFLVLALFIIGLAMMRHHAEESLKTSEIRLRSILENSLDPIGVSCNGIHRYVNPAYVRMFGYRDASALVGQPVVKVIAPDERALIESRIERRSRGEYLESSYETRGQRADGTQIEMEVHVSHYEFDGEQQVLVILRDVTERKLALREKESLIAELRDALARVKTLHGLLPTCAGCHKIRDDDGQWQDMETYISAHSDAGFSHGLCPTCAERLYPEVFGPGGSHHDRVLHS